ncbi:MAG: site-specific integrase [Planctomycetota bacterium]|nr:site-specific integrase [Planctomycetota bacterium]
MSTKRKPSYLLHKATGQARVRINGKDHYLGEYGSPESRERYDDLITEWFSKNGETAQYALCVDDLALLFMEHANQHYRKNGKPTSEISCIKTALRYLVAKSGRSRVRDFGPLAFKAVRQAMIDDGHCRKSINKHSGRIRRIFAWAVENEYCKPDILVGLQAVQGLQAGRTEAVETDPVKPVPQAFIDAVEPHVSKPVWGLIQVQLLTGARPGEVLAMRGRDINTSGSVWEYVPESHKTQHHGKGRIILIGPKAIEVVRGFLKSNLDAHLFSPRDVRKGTPGATRQPGERYDRDAYRNAIQRACRKAGVPEWHPHQLRHNAATNVRREADIDTARAVLGHSSVSTAELYAERDINAARAVMLKVG